MKEVKINRKADEILDLRGVPCPQNSARALMILAGMEQGKVLEIIIDKGEPLENVPSSLENENYKIIRKTRSEDDSWNLFVEA
jgi:TusA-related sulfurtransferase